MPPQHQHQPLQTQHQPQRQLQLQHQHNGLLPHLDAAAIVDAAATNRLRQVEETYADAVATARRDLMSFSGVDDIIPRQSPALATSTSSALSAQGKTLQTKIDNMEGSLAEILNLLKKRGASV